MTLSFKKDNLQDILVNALWSLIAWVAWSTIILVISFFISDFVNIPSTLKEAQIWAKTSSIFPLLLSIITLIWTTITIFLTYYILHLTSPNKYKKNHIIFWQITFFNFIIYLLITPIYIITWLKSYDNIMIVYLFHIIILTFWIHIILEVLNNYRHVLIWLYWNFLWLFVSILTTIWIFSSFSSGYAKLISLLVLLPIINFTITFFNNYFDLFIFIIINIQIKILYLIFFIK